jgi:hypothetical protein
MNSPQPKPHLRSAHQFVSLGLPGPLRRVGIAGDYGNDAFLEAPNTANARPVQRRNADVVDSTRNMAKATGIRSRIDRGRCNTAEG